MIATNGTIIRILTDKGFGFIQASDGTGRYFFHRSAVQNAAFENLRTGPAVTFIASTGGGGKGPRAENVSSWPARLPFDHQPAGARRVRIANMAEGRRPTTSQDAVSQPDAAKLNVGTSASMTTTFRHALAAEIANLCGGPRLLAQKSYQRWPGSASRPRYGFSKLRPATRRTGTVSSNVDAQRFPTPVGFGGKRNAISDF